jgi:hypothetical protein
LIYRSDQWEGRSKNLVKVEKRTCSLLKRKESEVMGKQVKQPLLGNLLLGKSLSSSGADMGWILVY